MHQKATLTCIFFFFMLFFTTTVITVLSLYFNQKAFGDGLTQENLPPASVGNRQASLFVKVNPPILTTDNRQDAFMQFRLFDEKNNQTIQHVTYEITITKGINATSSSSTQQQQPLLQDFFHAHNGLLTIKVQPTNGSLQLYGDRDPFQNALIADPGGSVNIKGPILLDGGLYHFHIEIFGIDNDRNIFIPENAPKFDSWLSVGDVYHNNWDYQNHNYNTTLISYYDKINNLNFDPAKKSFSWTMPFNWNLTRLQQQPVFVHEEMRLPKSWKGLGDSTMYNATVNSQPLSGRSLAIDPFSFPNAMVVHYLVNKNDILKLAQEQQQQQQVTKQANGNNNSSSTTGVMRFTLLPPSASAQQQISTSSDIVTNSSIHAAVSWSPNPLKPETQSTVKISFYDPVTSNPLSTNDIKYDMIILDENRTHTVITKPNLLAKNAADTQTITFPAKDIYQIRLEIKGLLKTGQTPDLTRNGIGIGTVVVPEFTSAGTLVSIGALFVILTIIYRLGYHKKLLDRIS